ncbi:MAG: hypothetical protein WCJ89_08585 [Actinomycetes bacterium]
MNELPDYFDGVIKILTTYIENRTDHFTMNFDGGHYIQGPYVQALQEHDNVLLIEASSNQFLNPPLSEMANQKMIFMGWRFYPESYLPNYTQFIDQSKVSPREIAEIMVRAIHFACGVDDTFALEINPKIEAARHIFDRIGAINE